MKTKSSQSSFLRTLKIKPEYLTKAAPLGVVAALVGASLLPMIRAGSPELLMGATLLSGLGTDLIKDFIKKSIQSLGKKSDEEILKETEDEILNLWNAPEEKGVKFRRELSQFIRQNGILQIALNNAPDAMKGGLVDSFAKLANDFEEFSWVLADIQKLLVETSAMVRHNVEISNEILTKVNLLAKNQRERSGKPVPQTASSVKENDDSPPADIPCPYKGLAAFQPQDVDYFFGRDELTAQLLAHLAGSSFLAVIGPSGSGKSSLVRAGVIPALWNGEIPGSEIWKTLIMRPGTAPLEELGVCVAAESKSVASDLVESLRKSEQALRLELKKYMVNQPEEVKLVLVVDQFEEVFTLCKDETAREHFIAALVDSSQNGEGHILVILTLRADFYGHCAAYSKLASLLSDNHVLVGKMTKEGLQQAIAGPAECVGLSLEPGLIEIILREAENEVGALPMISHALLETWKRRSGYALTVKGYLDSGGISGAITETANTVYNQLNKADQEITRNIFLHLVEVKEDQSPTSRRTQWSEFLSGGEDDEKIQIILKKLSDARLLSTDENTITIAHEALIDHWPIFQNWLEEDRESLLNQQHLSDAAQEWKRRGHDSNEFYRGARLAKALEWSKHHPDQLSRLDKEFLRKSNRYNEQQRKRIIYGLLIGFMIIFVVAIAAILQWRQAQKQANIALARQLAAQSQILDLNIGLEAIRSGLLSVEAGRRLPGFEADQALRRYLDVSALPSWTGKHDNRVYSVAYSPDGNSIVSGSYDNTIRVWEASTGKELVRMQPPYSAGGVTKVAYSRDGKYIVSGGYGIARVWSTLTGREVAQMKHQGYISSVGFSHDGKYVVSGSSDGSIRIWEALTGKEIAQMQHQGYISSVTFSPNGQYVLSGSYDKTARVWDAFTGKEVALMQHQDAVNSVDYSPKAELVVSGSHDGTIQIWVPLTGKIMSTFHHSGPVMVLTFSPDGRYILSGSADNTARLWDVTTGREIARFTHIKPVNAVAFSPDGKYAATGSNDETARAWDIRTGKELARMAHSNFVETVAFSPDGKKIVSGSVDGTLRVWEAVTGKDTVTLNHKASINSVAFSPDGNYMVTGSADSTTGVWETATGMEIAVIPTVGGVRCIKFTPDGRYVVLGDDYGNLQVWDMARQKIIHESKQDDFIWNIDISPDGRYAVSSSSATSSPGGNAKVWEVTNGREIFHMTVGGRVYAAVFSPDGRYVLTGSETMSGRVRIWEVSTGKSVATMEQITYPEAVAFSPDGKYIASNMAIWEVAPSRKVANIDEISNSPINKVAFSPDGKYVVASSHNGTLYVLDALTGAEINHVNYQVVSDVPFAFSKDGRYIVSGSGNGRVYVWETATGLEVAAVYHDGPVTAVAFSPDNRYVLSSSTDGTARLWYLSIKDLIHEACQRLPRNLSRDEWEKYMGDEPYHATCSNLPIEPVPAGTSTP